jgi:hypothetical protein
MVKKVLLLAAAALAVVAPAAGAGGWTLIGKASDRNSTWSNASVYSASVEYPVALRVIALSTSKARLDWSVSCYDEDFNSTRQSGSRRIAARVKRVVNLPVTVRGAETCYVTADLDAGMSFSGRRSTTSVWVQAR